MSEPQPHPFLDPSFHVAWSSLDPELIEEDITLALTKAQKNIDAIAGQDADAATYESTILALEDAAEEFSRAWG
ncbi:hypothetical protein [Cerasicoccus frondis]|uniref:hypothetical protein n=1 Tax=Cerasicoccus frondis TaxID=490090 RepID=UPI002852AB46|nr:hypothetical protein [Cerasicoccus frondis]